MTVGTKQKLAFQNEELSLNINFKQLQHSACEQLLGNKIDYLILCSIVIHPSCLNIGSDGAMGS
jgi:hypothetical protein